MNVRQVEELSGERRDDLHELYRGEWWTEDRERAGVDAVLEGSDEIVALRDAETDDLVAFARVLTDYTYEAFVFDVIVDTRCRGMGLGDRLMDAIVDAPALASVGHFELYRRSDLVGFYERWGFGDDLDDLWLLRLER